MLGAGGLAFSAADALVGFAVASGAGDKALGAQHSAHLSHGCLLGLIRRLLPMGSEPPRRYNEEEIKGFALYYRERNGN